MRTKLAKLMQRLKKDAGATAIAQNYKGTGQQRFRRQLWIHFKSGAVIDIWLEKAHLGLGGVVIRRPPGSDKTRAVVTMRGIPGSCGSPGSSGSATTSSGRCGWSRRRWTSPSRSSLRGPPRRSPGRPSR